MRPHFPEQYEILLPFECLPFLSHVWTRVSQKLAHFGNPFWFSIHIYPFWFSYYLKLTDPLKSAAPGKSEDPRILAMVYSPGAYSQASIGAPDHTTLKFCVFLENTILGILAIDRNANLGPLSSMGEISLGPGISAFPFPRNHSLYTSTHTHMSNTFIPQCFIFPFPICLHHHFPRSNYCSDFFKP